VSKAAIDSESFVLCRSLKSHNFFIIAPLLSAHAQGDQKVVGLHIPYKAVAFKVCRSSLNRRREPPGRRSQ
jgi:hypothetical protein